MIEVLRRLGDYGAWANRRVLDACRAIDDGEYKKPRAAFFGSIHGTLNHMVVANRIWLARLEGGDAGIAALDAIVCPDLAAVDAALVGEDRRIARFVDALSEDDAARVLDYHTVNGDAQSTPIGWILTHMATHATHHRGQVHDMLSQVPMQPPSLDLIYFLRDAG